MVVHECQLVFFLELAFACSDVPALGVIYGLPSQYVTPSTLHTGEIAATRALWLKTESGRQ